MDLLLTLSIDNVKILPISNNINFIDNKVEILIIFFNYEYWIQYKVFRKVPDT